MKIGVDLDEVLLEFLDAFCLFHNATYNTNHKKSDFKSYKFWETIGGTQEEAVKKVYAFHKTPYFMNIKPVSGAKEGIERLLNKNHELYVVTDRQNAINQETKEQIIHFFPNCFKDVFFGNKFARYGKSYEKIEIIQEHNMQCLIDDSIKHAVDCSNDGRKGIVISKPWNRKDRIKQDKLYYAKSWDKIN